MGQEKVAEYEALSKDWPKDVEVGAINPDDEVKTFLAEGGYDSVEDWARDSDFEERDGEWFYVDEFQPKGPVDIEGALHGAMEAVASDEQKDGEA